MTKYKAKPTEIDGIKFASKKEAKKYQELKLLERANLIKDLRTQVSYELIPSQKGGIRNERACKYIADFVYWDIEKNKEIILDTKGYRTELYICKRKLMKLKGQEITEE